MNKERLMQVLVAPVITEKATRLAENYRQVTFRVLTDATKREVAKAVELLFEVQVDRVQILNVKGKQKRHGQRLGQRQDWRKAYVRLKPGQDIDFGDAA
ncbi:large subunit ribosomal protein L23 [Allochromatium warmingii]|uniref:Large ribosomal subunit protein uL23 n=1 Tax=Allochromatium warmingii TaxID=61595 RepID=A0A1H3C9T3_ALLWA|nr:50S ribosomal protein L23 [Allochromatium warmingii]SDX50873.1 large subunit ribosomal protein L23 [Allochromatium warmingii]